MLFAAAVDSAAPLIASGGAVALLSAVGVILGRMIRAAGAQQELFVKRAWYRIEVLEREHRICHRRVALLVDQLHAEGIPISVDVWTVPERDEPALSPFEDLYP